MAPHLSEAEIAAQLLAYVRCELLADTADLEFDVHTPLLETGLIDSMKAAKLVNFIHHSLELELAAEDFNYATFSSIRNLAASLHGSAVDRTG